MVCRWIDEAVEGGLNNCSRLRRSQAAQQGGAELCAWGCARVAELNTAAEGRHGLKEQRGSAGQACALQVVAQVDAGCRVVEATYGNATS